MEMSACEKPFSENRILTTKKLTPAIFYQRSFGSDGLRAKRRKPHFGNERQRVILKNGACNVTQSRLTNDERIKYLRDIFTTLVDAKWRWTLLVFFLTFASSFLIFALIWWEISISHGDLEPEHLPPVQRANGWTPCVTEIHNFTSSFLFSVETQITTGYGGRAITEACPDAIIVMCLQSIVGMMIQALMIGVVYAKLTRPKHRTQTLLFSRNAVVCTKNKKLCLMFRVGDIRKSHIIDATIRAQLVMAGRSKSELNVTAEGSDGNLFFIWPTTIIHVIDSSSPFYYLSAVDMLQQHFEILVVLEGTIESTGQATQARSSYLSTEVLWGHTFRPVVQYNEERGGYEAIYSKFDQTKTVDTPLCSAAELEEHWNLQKKFVV